VPHRDGVRRRILHFQSPQAISLHLSASDVDFAPPPPPPPPPAIHPLSRLRGFYNPLTAWTHYTAHIINTAYNVFLLVILGSIKSALLIRIADTVCLLWNSVRICYRFSIRVSLILFLRPSPSLSLSLSLSTRCRARCHRDAVRFKKGPLTKKITNFVDWDAFAISEFCFVCRFNPAFIFAEAWNDRQRTRRKIRR